MKIKLRCKEENKALYEKMLRDGGFEISEDTNLTFVEDNYVPEYIIGKSNEDSVMLYIGDIILIESCGRDIQARTRAGTFKLKGTLESYEKLLSGAGYFRISQSVILPKQSIERISQGLSMRFHLTLKTGIKVDVTRSHYYAFKDFIGL